MKKIVPVLIVLTAMLIPTAVSAEPSAAQTAVGYGNGYNYSNLAARQNAETNRDRSQYCDEENCGDPSVCSPVMNGYGRHGMMNRYAE